MIQIIDNDPRRVGEWVINRVGGLYVRGQAIGLERQGRLEAGVLFDEFNGASIRMHVAIEGRLTRDFLWYAFHYPFNECKVNKIIGLVPSVKTSVLEFDKHIGFVEECRVKDAHPFGDIVILSMTRKQCRFLELKHGFSRKRRSATAC